MSQPSRAPLIGITTALLALPFLAACSGRSAGGAQASGPPDLNGVWSAPFTPDISKPLGHQPPFTPYAASLFKKRRRDRRSTDAVPAYRVRKRNPSRSHAVSDCADACGDDDSL